MMSHPYLVDAQSRLYKRMIRRARLRAMLPAVLGLAAEVAVIAFIFAVTLPPWK